MRYLLILILFCNCTYYFYKDPTPFQLTEKEKQIFNSKKILYIGFDLIRIERIDVGRNFFENKVIEDRDHLKIIEFLNETSIDTSTSYFNKNFKSTRNGSSVEEGFFENGIGYSSFGLNGNKIEQFKKRTNPNIKEENLKKFLENYLKITRHKGLNKIKNTLEISENKINFNLSNFDYILVGVGDLKNKEIIENKVNLFFFIISYGIIPITIDRGYSTNLYLYDKKLNLLKKTEIEDFVTSITAIWVTSQNSKDYENQIFEKDIAEFLKNSVKLIKD